VAGAGVGSEISLWLVEAIPGLSALCCFFRTDAIPEIHEEKDMKGDESVLKTLNALLADELTAINQYMVGSEMCANWGYERLHKAIEKRAIEEMKHAEKLIGRILFLDGKPTVSKLNNIHIGKDVEAIHHNDHTSELDAVKSYNEGIRLCVQQGDNGTRDMLQSILKDEEAHVDWLEEQMDQISQMGIQIYLAEQAG
jgi:bacterioferritin